MTTTLDMTVQLTREDTGTTTGQLVELTVGDYRQAATIPVSLVEITIAISTLIGNVGHFYCKNHTDPATDPTNYVDIGYATGVYDNRLYAGEQAAIPLLPTAANIFVVASDANTKFQYEITERT
jgi:hypothetical protein